jgi:hypothetical protein
MSYYQRQTRTDANGLRVFSTPEDHASEDRVARILERAFNCTLHAWPTYHPVDWFAARGGKMVALLELKTRSHASTAFDTVWLNVRKWSALYEHGKALAVPSLFVVQFTDQLRYIDLRDVNAARHRIGGCRQVVKSFTDIEPVIEVEVASMKVVPQGGA